MYLCHFKLYKSLRHIINFGKSRSIPNCKSYQPNIGSLQDIIHTALMHHQKSNIFEVIFSTIRKKRRWKHILNHWNYATNMYMTLNSKKKGGNHIFPSRNFPLDWLIWYDDYKTQNFEIPITHMMIIVRLLSILKINKSNMQRYDCT